MVMRLLSWDWPAKGKSLVRTSPGEKHGSMLWESLKFGILKLSHMPEIRILDTVRVNTGFTGKSWTQEGCSSVRAHLRVWGEANFQPQG